ncbi:L,D-transpeptidase family protein [Mannheimia sp. AT1]|uniref:L,D-transpeptidase family protein n=1 Tax=Mannheimia cairinae TaxID=3025936 RepID=A0ABT5MNZ6_9PAST|nr:L,D-transpeptidase family protein [Mannheimia cairinae]MDD0823209.1 L,D-transpeptidase family protein [Mannheimia cairinae]MDD0825765.1 L,D-transpeptidase family protein [Mannheimia cairinae]
MNKVKTFKLLPIIAAFSGSVIAQTASLPSSTSAAQAEVTPVVQDTILPQLSFAAQQARAAELMKQADYALQQEQIRQEQARKFAEAETRVQQEIGSNTLLLSQTTTKIYLDNQFTAMWSDKSAEQAFLKEYALFSASGVSSKSAKALQQILNQPEGLGRDILLTDSFLDYLYYNKNVSKNANTWLYNLGSYRTKTPSADLVGKWVNAVNDGNSGKFVVNLVPRNHLYQDTAERVLAMAGASKQGNTGTGANGSFYKLALNAQRLRIIPSFNNGIFVNIPSYQLYYFRDGALALKSKVIVGRNDRRTPVMYSKLSNVVVNPPWHVPTSIMTKDIVPKLARDPGYAERASLEILDGSGNKVNPRSINWSQYVNAKSTPYRIRQKAGDDSALGRYKFNMPSSDAIYLHDTPNRGLFGRTGRALSSGCVRVEKSDELATILLKEAGWSQDRKNKVLSSKKTTSAQIRSDNPVYLYYVTSWVEGGKIQTLPDIYNFDAKIPQYSINWAKLKSII